MTIDKTPDSGLRILKMVDEIEDYAIILLDRDGNIENWNKGAEKIKGYSAAEIIGKHFSIFYNLADKAALLPQWLLDMAAINGKVQHEGWRLRKNGSEFWSSLLINAIHDDDGNVIGFTKIVRDLTVLRQAQDLLRKSEERYNKMIMEVADYAIILLDKGGNIENWNKGAENIKGYTAKEILGKNFRIFYTKEDRENKIPEKLIKEAIFNGHARHEGWRVRKDGSYFWGLISITALHGENNEIIGFSKVTRDLTDKMFAEKQQEQYIESIARKNAELEQFTYIASHDLQEPLRTITSFNDLLKENYGNLIDEDGNMFIEMIGNSAERMRKLIAGLLDYSLIGVNQLLNEVNCNKLIKNVQDDFFKLIVESKAVINYTPMPIIKGYEIALGQLFQNLIGNAITYRNGDRPPVVIITAEKRSNDWLFMIKDNGIGMNKKHLSKIFQIFQRLHPRDVFPGSGIGLANCKKIVELHGGKIWAESEPGEGSKFYFTIPLIIDKKNEKI